MYLIVLEVFLLHSLVADTRLLLTGEPAPPSQTSGTFTKYIILPVLNKLTDPGNCYLSSDED